MIALRSAAVLIVTAAVMALGLALLGGSSPQAVGTPPAGLDLTFSDDPHAAVEVIADGEYYIDSLSVFTEVHGEESEILTRLKEESAFAVLDWQRLNLERLDWLPEFDGSYQMQKFYQQARWMGGDHRFTVRLYAGRELLDGPFTLTTTDQWPAPDDDPFATRRFSAMIFAHGAAAEGDTRGAEFSAQAWIQLRNGNAESGTFSIPAHATHLDVEWDQLPGRALTIPLKPVRSSDYGYGFEIQAEAAPPANGDYFVPGEAVRFDLTFVDGLGNRLHPEGSLPTYGEFINGEVDSGLQYYAFFPGIVYYRDKNREGVLLASLTGPNHLTRQTHKAVPTLDFLTGPIQVAATTEVDRFSSQWAIIPPAPTVFGGPENWDAPVPDHQTFQIPENAKLGQYTFAIKARRLYRGEESLAGAVVEIDVGPPEIDHPNAAPVLTGNCEECHKGNFALSRMLHHIDDTSTCTGCHLPLEFEKNNLLPHRVHRVHNLSDRYQENRRDCTVCHLDPKPTVEDKARWLVCTGCHNPRETHYNMISFGELHSCADAICHHTVQRRIHIMD